MSKKLFKIFKNKEKALTLIKVPSDNYYRFIADENGKGNSQFLITTDLMISFIIKSIKYNAFINLNKVELYDDDDEFSEELMNYFNLYKSQKLSEDSLHTLLDSIEDDCSIDIVKIKISNIKFGSMELMSNGEVSFSADYWGKLLLDVMTEAWNA
ncbi:hypothetical protein [Apilactobacillus bombintestini]|uniref:Uncharacterized protein n=1 Tax=Apilactobacillus bombintestini TaxID=2419772 RepID=A0A387AUP8_9LACO|nr:hypothetical protein [Apilactobacillus bombintestini]AYF93071.1 hypothetical protein D7I45_06145 [Apilactobacillus bombintestini]